MRKDLKSRTCCFIGHQEIPPGEERKILMRVTASVAAAHFFIRNERTVLRIDRRAWIQPAGCRLYYAETGIPETSENHPGHPLLWIRRHVFEGQQRIFSESPKGIKQSCVYFAGPRKEKS